MFSVRIVTTDHYLAPPVRGLDVTHSEFRGADVKRAPVLRIFGATPAGQKTCMHVHGVFPYLYVPYDGTQPWERYLRLFAASLDKAINVANNNAKSNLQHVFKISIVSGIPMYGYHATEEEFLKIYLYNPTSVKKAADLLLGGAVMNKPFQPHEAHIPYNLQFFIDYNLYGMNLINVDAVKFRQESGHDNEHVRAHPDENVSSGEGSGTPCTPTLGVLASPLSRSGSNTPSRRVWDAPNIPSELYLDASVERQTTCELEVDVVAADILNRLEVDANVGTNPGLAAIWEDERQRRRDKGESSHITPPESQDREGVEVADSENALRQKLLEIIDHQKPFHDSESDGETDMSQGSELEYAATPASQVDSHLSQEEELAYSEDTVILENEEEENPVISLESIQRVLSFSQSFSQSSQHSGEGDKTLAEMLAAMADESSPSSSQLSASQVAALEEQDSVIGGQLLVDEETLREEEEETLEMTQKVWGEEEKGEDDKSDEESQEDVAEDHNMEGMDDTWADSQWFTDEEKEDDIIPQLDGASDEKKDVSMNQRKRLGMSQVVSHMGMQNSQGFPPGFRYDSSLYRPPTVYTDNTRTHHPPPFSPGADRFPVHREYAPAVDTGYGNAIEGMSRRNWEHEIWQQQQQQHSQQQLMSQGHIHQSYPGYQQTHSMQSSYPRPPHISDQSYQGTYHYNQYAQGSHDGYCDQRSFPSRSPEYMGHSEQLSPNYMPNLSPTTGHVPHSIAQHTMSLQSQQQHQQISSQSQHMSPQTSRHGAPINSHSPISQHLSPHTITPHRPSHVSPQSMQYPSDCMSSKPVFQPPTRDPAASYQQMLNSPVGQDSVNRSVSRSSIHSSASHMSNSSESDMSLQHINSDLRLDNIAFDPMMNGAERQSTSMNDLPNMTSVELTSSECSTSVQCQIGNNSHDDIFGASPQTLLGGSTPSLSVDESNESASETMIDMTGCDDFIPGGYDSGGSDRPDRQNSLLDERMHQFTNLDSHPARLGERRESCPSSLSGLFNLVSSVTDSSSFRSRSKLSLKRTVSDTGTASVWTHNKCVDTPGKKKSIVMNPASFPWGANGDSSQVNTMVSNPKSFQNNPATRKRGRPPKKKLGLEAFTPRHLTRKAPDPSYTYVFHVPTPVYKRLKIRNTSLHHSKEVEIVRMHPMDARRYSLLKIGTEMVRIPKLTAKDLQKFSKLQGLQYAGSKPTPSFANNGQSNYRRLSGESDSNVVINNKAFPSMNSRHREERIPVLSQFSSYLNQSPMSGFGSQRPVNHLNVSHQINLPVLASPKNREESLKVKKLLKEKINLFRSNLEVVQQPSRLQDILERKIQAVPNKNKVNNSKLPMEMGLEKANSATPQGQLDSTSLSLTPFKNQTSMKHQEILIPKHSEDPKSQGHNTATSPVHTRLDVLNVGSCQGQSAMERARFATQKAGNKDMPAVSIQTDSVLNKSEVKQSTEIYNNTKESRNTCRAETQTLNNPVLKTAPVSSRPTDKSAVFGKEMLNIPAKNFSEGSIEEKTEANKPREQKTLINSSSDVDSNRQFQMDFSSLEDPLMEQLPGKPSDVPDSHHLLHTPPLLLESDQEDRRQQLFSAERGVKQEPEEVAKMNEDCLNNVLSSSCVTHTTNSGFYSDKDPSSEVDSIFSVPHSRASSRASSRKESSDSSESAVGRSKKLKKRKSLDGYDLSTFSFRNKRPSVNYSPKAFRHMFDDEDTKKEFNCRKRQKKNRNDPFKNMIVGVHYIVVGRFRGCRSMKVLLKRPKLDGPSVNVHDYFAYNLEEKRLFDRAVHRDLQRPSSAESTSTISEYLMESRIVNCKSSESELSDAPLDFPSSRSSTPRAILDEKTGELQSGTTVDRSNSYTELCLGGYHCSNEPLETWLEETTALHTARATEPITFPKPSSDAYDTSQHQFNDVDCVKSYVEHPVPDPPSAKESPPTPDVIPNSVHPKPSPPLSISPPRLCDLRTESTGSLVSMNCREHSTPVASSSHYTSLQPQSSVAAYHSSSSTKSSPQLYPTSVHVPSSTLDHSSTDSSRDVPYKYTVVSYSKHFPRKPKIRSSYVDNKNLDDKKGKRKSLTPNQRLGVAFLSTRPRRKKSVSGFKLMNSLSILHQATLANLTDSVSYADGTDDYKTKYEDVMYKLALVSPPHSDKGETSPPVPLSPEDGDKDTLLKVQDKPKAKSEVSLIEKHPQPSSASSPPSTSTLSSISTAPAQVSMDSIYETPLSSVENNKESKSPEMSVLWAAESDSLPDIPETSTQPLDLSHASSSRSDIEHKSPEIKDVVVCLTPLSSNDISRLTAELKTKKESILSPPNLGSPISHPVHQRHSGSSSDASTACDSNRTPPPCLTPHRSPYISDCSLYDSHNDSQHSWKSDRSRDNTHTEKSSRQPGDVSDPISQQKNSNHTGEQSSVQGASLSQMCNSDIVSLSHDSSSNQSKASDTNTSTDSRKENCSGMDKHSSSQKGKGPEKSSTKYSELKLSVRNLLTPRENAINASTLPAHYDMDCPIVIKTSQYEDISSDDDDEPGDATRRKQKRTAGSTSDKTEDKDRKNKENDGRGGYFPYDSPGHSQGSSGGGSSGGSSLPSPDVYYGNVVLRPETYPPSRDVVSVSAQMYGLYTSTAQNAYCSNPDDLPDKPRDQGGHVLRLDTNRVRDLEEFESSAGTEGLKTWRTVFAADSKLFASQNVEPLWEKLDKDPGFKFMLSEDKKIAITPCHLPPKLKTVQDWYKARVAHVKLKAQTNSVTNSAADTGSKVTVEEYVHFCELAAEITVEESKTDDEIQDVSRSPRSEDRSGEDISVKEDSKGSKIIADISDLSTKDLKLLGDSEADASCGVATGEVDDTVVVENSVEDVAAADVVAPASETSDKVSVSGVGNVQCDLSAMDVEEDDEEQDVPPQESGSSGIRRKNDVDSSEKDSELCIEVVIETDSNEKTCCDEGIQDMDTSTEDDLPVDDEGGSKEKTDGSDPQTKKESSPPVQIVHLKKTVSDGDVVKTDESVKQIVNTATTKRTDKPKSRWDQKVTNSSPPSISSSSEAGECSQPPVHSTPVRRRSVDWLEPLCTPISTNQNKAVAAGSSNHGSSPFVTPRKPGPIRRLSSNTEKSLCRSILASQLKSQLATPTPKRSTSQIDGPTPKNTYGFKLTQQNYQDAKALHEHQYLTAMSMEVHVETRGDLQPDPEVDTMQAIFYSIFNDVPPSKGERHITGAIIVHGASARAVQQAASLVQGASPKPSTSKEAPKPSTSKASPKPSTSKAAPKPSTSTAHPSQTPKGDPKQGTSRDIGSAGTAQSGLDSILKKSGIEDINTEYVSNETELIDSFLKLIQKWDPDILIGYEIQMLSWGYVLQRASQLGTDLCTKISRTPETKSGNHASAAKDEWAADYTSEINIVGRIVLNLWRLLKHEVSLNIYSFENVAFHILHRRIPLYTTRTLNLWFNHRTHHYRWRVVEHYRTKVEGVLQIMEQLDLIGKTSEFARVFGIEFYHVLSRGSQYRVESMMLRLAKPMNFIPVSPGVEQRARQRAPECISLNLEPESRFYPHPVVVVDFQSLYPSIMIAYNYCFSTCLGRIHGLAAAHEGPFEFGCTSLKMPPSLLKKLEKDVTISPNGVVFLKEHIRKGVLPRMVGEILNTRIMVKKAMKGYKDDKVLYRLLDARQLGLKLIANVTYGYTGANFSGRMPCIEVADSIVRKARETLERAIKLVEDTPRWRAKVVYGDTDSMFIHLEGRTKDEAFQIGQEIADSVTAMFPKPIKLKFEKVYMPCVLQTKKRYVGFSYETQDQKEPVFDAKGIETVRRDTCSAVSKILERCIKLLFTTRDISQVKAFVLRQCHKFMEGKVSIKDCIFAKEFRGMMGYKPGACVPGLVIARKLVRQDRRAEPRVGERIPYVIVYGTPGMPLIQLVRQPLELLRDPTLRINGTYYITKQILPPLHRIFSLIGIDVFIWYQNMPKVIRAVPQAIVSGDSKKGTISQYFSVSNCPVCDEQTKESICAGCMEDPQMVSVLLTDRIRNWDSVYHKLAQVCHSCMGVQDETQPCISLDCPILFRRTVGKNDVSRGEHLRQCLEKVLKF